MPSSPSTCAFNTTRSVVAGRTRAWAPSSRAGLVEGRADVAERVGEADEDEVAERVPGELGAAEPVLERLRPTRARHGDRDEALPQVARWDDVRGPCGAARSTRRRRQR